MTAKCFGVLPSSLISGLSGLASYNLDVACTYWYYLNEKRNMEDQKLAYDKKGNKKSVNFGMMPNNKNKKLPNT